MTAFFNEPTLKSAVIERLEQHRRLDQFVQGIYFEDGRGCHLGCLTHSKDSSHEMTERLFGIPIRVAYLLEAVFERLPKDDCECWAVESIRAIPCGANLDVLHHRLAAWLLGDAGLLTITGANREAIERCRQLHSRAADGLSVTASEWSAAESAARSAAESAAGSAAWSAAESAAESAAWSAAESAAWSAAGSAAEAAAWAAAWAAARAAAWAAAWSAALKPIAIQAIELLS